MKRIRNKKKKKPIRVKKKQLRRCCLPNRKGILAYDSSIKGEREKLSKLKQRATEDPTIRKARVDEAEVPGRRQRFGRSRACTKEPIAAGRTQSLGANRARDLVEGEASRFRLLRSSNRKI